MHAEWSNPVRGETAGRPRHGVVRARPDRHAAEFRHVRDLWDFHGSARAGDSRSHRSRTSPVRRQCRPSTPATHSTPSVQAPRCTLASTADRTTLIVTTRSPSVAFINVPPPPPPPGSPRAPRWRAPTRPLARRWRRAPTAPRCWGAPAAGGVTPPVDVLNYPGPYTSSVVEGTAGWNGFTKDNDWSFLITIDFPSTLTESYYFYFNRGDYQRATSSSCEVVRHHLLEFAVVPRQLLE